MDCSWYVIPSACFNSRNSVEIPKQENCKYLCNKASKLTEGDVSNAKMTLVMQISWALISKCHEIKKSWFSKFSSEIALAICQYIRADLRRFDFNQFETMKASGLRWTKASANSIIGETNDWYCNLHAILSTHVLKTDRDNFHVHQRELFVINTASHCNVAELYFRYLQVISSAERSDLGFSSMWYHWKIFVQWETTTIHSFHKRCL